MAHLPPEPGAALQSALLPREEYYRPQRAAELRRKALRLERLQGLTGATILGVGSLAAVAMVGFVIYLRLPVFLLEGILFLVWLAFGLLRLRDRIPAQVRRLREQAEVLEAEHQAHALALGATVPNAGLNPEVPRPMTSLPTHELDLCLNSVTAAVDLAREGYPAAGVQDL